jgi:hypothetical protein
MTDTTIAPPTVACDYCGGSFEESSLMDTGYRQLCDDCYGHNVWGCDYCGDYFDDVHEIGYDVDGCYTYCDSCADRHASYCESCDSYHTDGPCDSGYLSGLEDYSYKPAPYFHGGSASWLYFGAEIEMESRNGGGQEALDHFMNEFDRDEFYYKSDGSLMSDDSFEMVSHPRTLDSWQALLPRLQDTMQRARNLGMRSWNTDTCGIHIHIDSRAFGGSSAHLYRFTQFIYRNPAEMHRLAGRGSVHYAEFMGDYSRRVTLPRDIKDRKRYGGAGDRYLAVNLQNRKTVEVRMFRGSLKPERLIANIEFLHALVSYTRDMTTQQAFAGGMKFDVFAHYALMQRDTYPHLAALIADKFDMASA